MHFKLLKMIAISGFLAALRCNKFVFVWGSAPRTSLAALEALPKHPNRRSRSLKGPSSQGIGGEGREQSG